jgi:hypothetical protein
MSANAPVTAAKSVADDSSTPTFGYQLYQLTETYRHACEQRLKEAHFIRNDPDFRKLAYLTTAAGFLQGVAFQAEGNSDNPLAAIVAVGEKIKNSLNTGKPPKWNKAEQAVFDSTLHRSDYHVSEFADIFRARSDSDENRSRRYIRKWCNISAGLGIAAAAMGIPALLQRNTDLTPEHKATALRDSDIKLLRESAQEELKMADELEKRDPQNIEKTLDRLETVQAWGKLTHKSMNKPTSPTTDYMGLAALAAAVMACGAAIRAGIKWEDARGGKEKLQALTPHLQEIIKATAEVIEKQIGVKCSESSPAR